MAGISPADGPSLESRIVEATLRCVARWGIGKTTLYDVAREARCGRATIYRTFPGGKTAVLQAAFRHELARAAAIIDEAVRDETTLEGVLVAGFVAGARLIDEHEALQFVFAHEPDAVLPYLGTGKLSIVFSAAALVVRPHLEPYLPADEVARAAEWVTRVVLSYALGPSPTVDLRNREDAERLVRRYVLPALVEPVPAIP